MSSAARNICGYLSGLSWPSVTDMITTFARSPRSNMAGHTRLPTFSISRIEPGLGSSTLRPRATMSASRWQPAPVLIWTTLHPVARIRSGSVTTTSSLPHPHVVHISGLQLHFLDGQLLAAQDLEVGAPARAQRDHVVQLDFGPAGTAARTARDVDDLQLRSLERGPLGA